MVCCGVHAVVACDRFDLESIRFLEAKRMDLIINPGQPSDPAAMPLHTKQRTWINNEQRAELLPEILSAAVSSKKSSHPAAVLRSISGTYNCLGLTFASRRTCIDPDQLDKILREDGYRGLGVVEAPCIGDIVVYKNNLREPLHVAVIVSIKTNVDPNQPPYDIMVLSKWGFEGEYIHSVGYVPDALGTPQEFWTERKGL